LTVVRTGPAGGGPAREAKKYHQVQARQDRTAVVRDRVTDQGSRARVPVVAFASAGYAVTVTSYPSPPIKRLQSIHWHVMLYLSIY
jgi:hypothetical protein